MPVVVRPGKERAPCPIRFATWIICQASSRASPGGFDQLVPLLGAALAVAEDALALDPGGRRQNEVGHGGRRRRVDVGDHEEASVAGLRVRSGSGWACETQGLVTWIHIDLDVAAGEGAEHVDGVVARLGRDGAFRLEPQIFSAFLARCSGFITTMSAGSRLDSVPTSRAVPQALMAGR